MWVFAPTFYFGEKDCVNNLSITKKVQDIASDVIDKESLDLVHVEVVGSDKHPIVRVFIDKSTGVTHDDCSDVSLQIGAILDGKDFIPSSYVLEVSSPGVERGLYSLNDFRRFVDRLAKVKTNSFVGGQRNFTGRIVGVEGEEIIFDDKTNGLVRFAFDKIKKANLKIDLDEDCIK